MVSVTLRFLATLLGTLAAFFIASHVAHAGGIISAYTLSRVDEFYRLLVAPLTHMEASTQKTASVIAAALVLQGLLIYTLFRRWDRPPVKKEIAVEVVDRELPERLRGGVASVLRNDLDISHETEAPTGPSPRALEAARRLAATR